MPGFPVRRLAGSREARETRGTAGRGEGSFPGRTRPSVSSSSVIWARTLPTAGTLSAANAGETEGALGFSPGPFPSPRSHFPTCCASPCGCLPSRWEWSSARGGKPFGRGLKCHSNESSNLHCCLYLPAAVSPVSFITA